MNLLQLYIVFVLVYLLYNVQTEWFATVLVINNSSEKLVKVQSYTEKESRHRHFSRIFCKMDGFFRGSSFSKMNSKNICMTQSIYMDVVSCTRAGQK